jgi:hypothetical protein
MVSAIFPRKDMSDDKSQTTEEGKDKSIQSTSTRDLIETITQLQADVENVKLELKKVRSIPSGKISLVFTVPGVLSLIFSVIKNSQILAFIGLGLIFWGALFFFVRPLRYVESSLLDSSAISSYYTLDRMIGDLKYRGKGYYIPLYPKEVHFSEDPDGPKDTIAFISADRDTNMPSTDDITKSKFLLENPKGICVAPPGLGLLTYFEKKLKRGDRKTQLDDLCEALPQLIVENFQLAKEMEMKTENDQVNMKILGSVYKNLYGERANLKSIHLLGCPLTSAIACAIAKTTGKIITIDKDTISSDGETIKVWCHTIED